jgi:hypothetical protein
MAIPAAAAFAVLDREVSVKIFAAGLALIGLVVGMSGGGMLGACGGIVAMAGVWIARNHVPAQSCPVSISQKPRWLFRLISSKKWSHLRPACLWVAGLAAVLLIIWPRLPRDNPQILWRSLSPYGQTIGLDAQPREEPTARLRRNQAVWNLMRFPGQAIHGAGLGRFQEAIAGQYAPPYFKPGKNTDDEAQFDMGADEPFTFGLFETVAVETGGVGLLLLVWVFLTWAALALRAFFTSPNHDQRLLALASLGAMVGAFVFSFFGNPAIRGCGGVMAFFMGLAWAQGEERPGNP